jgi:hypothetical protein
VIPCFFVAANLSADVCNILIINDLYMSVDKTFLTVGRSADT